MEGALGKALECQVSNEREMQEEKISNRMLGK